MDADWETNHKMKTQLVAVSFSVVLQIAMRPRTSQNNAKAMDAKALLDLAKDGIPNLAIAPLVQNLVHSASTILPTPRLRNPDLSPVQSRWRTTWLSDKCS